MSKKIHREYYKVLSTTVIFSMLFGSSHAIAAPAVGHEKQTQKKVSASSPFLDFDQVSDWAKNAVLKMKEQGIMVGDRTGQFRPLDKMTRQEVASTITNVLHLAQSKSATSSFPDVPSTYWGKDAIDAVKTVGIMRGDEKGNFHPNAPMTREELAVLLVNAIKADTKGKGNILPFVDKNQVSAWAKPAVQVALEQGLLRGDGKNFNPKKPVERQEMASVLSNLMDRVFSSSHHAIIDTIKGDTVTISGSTYHVAENLKELMNETNAAVLQKANIDFESSNHILTKITYLELVKNGKPAKTGEKEFAENIVLEGHGATIDGDVKVGADYVTIRNLTVNGNFEIGPEMENDFYGYKVHVNGKTSIKGGSPHTIVFEDGALGPVDMKKRDVRMEAVGSTKVGEITVSSNATIHADSNVTIPKVTIVDGVKNVTLNASVEAVVVESHSDMSLSGTGNIGNLTVQNQSYVTLNTTGTITSANVPDMNSRIVMQAGSKVTNLSIPTGSKVEDVVTNYAESKTQISNVSNGTTNSSSVPTSRGGGGSSSGGGSTGDQTPPVVTYTTGNSITIGSSVVARANEPGMLYLVPSNENPKTQTEFEGLFTNGRAKKAAVSVSNMDTYVTTSGLIAGNYKVYAVDRAGNVSVPTPTIHLLEPVVVNHAPTVQNGVNNVNAIVTDGVKTVSVANVFADEDNDALIYTAVSSATNVATVGVTGSDVKITPVNAGTATITVTANDGNGGTVQTQFNVTFNAAPPVNRAPVVANEITDKNMATDDVPFTVDLTNVFTDADDDALMLTATSSVPGVATVVLNGTNVEITPVNEGTATITVTASDGNGGSVQTTFQVNVGEKKTVFISELVWGESDSFLQAIELYNPTDKDIDASKIKIVRNDGGEDITISPDGGYVISSGSTFTIGESFYSGDPSFDYYMMMGFNNDSLQPVQLDLYYDDQLIDTAQFVPHKSLARVSGTVSGSTHFDESEWSDEGEDYTDGLNLYP